MARGTTQGESTNGGVAGGEGPATGSKRKIKTEKVDPESPSERKHAKLSSSTSDRKRRIKQEEEEQVEWRWWEEEKYTDGRKWTSLSHMGPVFAPEYVPLPQHVCMKYAGRPVRLSARAEEVMTFYAKMITNAYTEKELFNQNFMRDWVTYMTADERQLIRDLRLCDFGDVHLYFEQKAEQRKALSKEEKLAIKAENDTVRQKYGFCMWDGHCQPVGNYKIEPPGLFRGRGEHPRQGCVKKRIMPEDVVINCGSKIKPPEAPDGHRWKEVRCDNKVSWLATWTENVMNNNKYIMLNASARVKAERDWQKYEKARKLHRIIGSIREQYQTDWRNKEMRVRQRAVALYFIDKLALRVGNEKEDDEADTVGCCSLRCEHIRLHEHLEGYGDHVVEFDFLGKDSIRYHNFVSVVPRVFKNVNLFLQDKKPDDDLFDRVSTSSLNQYLTELMDGLTAKVFRTYNASWTLQDQLDKLTAPECSVHEKWLAYNRANRQVAILCNHQRTIPKTHDKSMEGLRQKIDAKRESVAELQRAVKDAEAEYKKNHSVQAKKEVDKKTRAHQRAIEQLSRLDVQATQKEENKQIALGTSKLNYLDPRISVAWCKKFAVPIEKIYSKTHRDKFRWAIHMADERFHFFDYEGEIELQQIEPTSSGDNNCSTEE